jgi:hypothetical protein
MAMPEAVPAAAMAVAMVAVRVVAPAAVQVVAPAVVRVVVRAVVRAAVPVGTVEVPVGPGEAEADTVIEATSPTTAPVPCDQESVDEAFAVMRHFC